MYKNKKILAIIPARSGSKGLPDKNIKKLDSKPLIHYTINAALESKIFDRVIVSTDCEKYAQIAKQCRAEVPFLRSAENSSDKASTISVIKEVLNQLDEKYDIVAILQPTSPLRTSEDIKNAVSLFFEKDANAVVSVNQLYHPMSWINILPDDLSMDGFIKEEYLNKTRQEIQPSYIINGAIYLIKTDIVKENINLYQKGTYAYIMDEKNSVDIDTELDFVIAESLLQVKKGL